MTPLKYEKLNQFINQLYEIRVDKKEPFDFLFQYFSVYGHSEMFQREYLIH